MISISACRGSIPPAREIKYQATTAVPAAAITQNNTGTGSCFRQTPKTAVNSGKIAATVAAWLAGALCNATAVRIGKIKTMPTAAKHNRNTCLLDGTRYFPRTAQRNAIVPAPAPLAKAMKKGSNPRSASRALTKDRLKQSTPREVKIQPSNSCRDLPSSFVRLSRTSEDKSSFLSPPSIIRKGDRIPSIKLNLAQLTRPEQIQSTQYSTRTV
jgi:hypothetical protein